MPGLADPATLPELVITALHPLGSLDDRLYACSDAELRILVVDPDYAERAGELLARSDAVPGSSGRAGRPHHQDQNSTRR